MSNHFDSIADDFNRIWTFSPEYKDFVHQHILEKLELGKDDVLADIGGGTGTFTARLAEDSGARHVYCIEPSRPMCDIASQQPGIKAICCDAHAVLTLDLGITKVLFKEVIHHITDRKRFFKALYEILPYGGKVLIITRPQEILFPFFDKAKQKFAENQPPLEQISDELLSCGFEVKTELDEHTFYLSKREWFDMLRNRFMSDLGSFSDAEIETGIQQIDARFDDSTLLFCDRLIFIVGNKQS